MIISSREDIEAYNEDLKRTMALMSAKYKQEEQRTHDRIRFLETKIFSLEHPGMYERAKKIPILAALL